MMGAGQTRARCASTSPRKARPSPLGSPTDLGETLPVTRSWPCGRRSHSTAPRLSRSAARSGCPSPAATYRAEVIAQPGHKAQPKIITMLSQSFRAGLRATTRLHGSAYRFLFLVTCAWSTTRQNNKQRSHAQQAGSHAIRPAAPPMQQCQPPTPAARRARFT